MISTFLVGVGLAFLMGLLGFPPVLAVILLVLFFLIEIANKRDD